MLHDLARLRRFLGAGLGLASVSAPALAHSRQLPPFVDAALDREALEKRDIDPELIQETLRSRLD